MLNEVKPVENINKDHQGFSGFLQKQLSPSYKSETMHLSNNPFELKEDNFSQILIESIESSKFV